VKLVERIYLLKHSIMKRQILLTLWIVLIVNGLLWLGYFLINNYFQIVPDSTWTWNIVVTQQQKVITQKITRTENISSVQSKIIQTVKNLSNSVVSIVISKNLNVYYYADPFSLRPYVETEKKKVGWWSWIIVSKDGYILTNKHVVADLDADYSVVTKNWDVYKVDKIWTDPVLDLAVIHIVKNNGDPVFDLQPATVTDVNSKNPIWEFVIAIWNALAEYSNTVTLWILSAKWRHLDNNNGSLYIGLYQTDAAINPWNSGGPLINLNEEVIWVNTAITVDWQGIGFAIPISKQLVEATLDSIKKYGVIKRPLLGIQFIQINKTIAKKYQLPAYKWVLVQNVIPNSPAFTVWIKKWDIILQIDWNDITTDSPIIYRLFTHKIGDTVTLLINRNGKLMEKKVKLLEW